MATNQLVGFTSPLDSAVCRAQVSALPGGGDPSGRLTAEEIVRPREGGLLLARLVQALRQAADLVRDLAVPCAVQV
jgi:hypothetical protein